MGDFYECFYEDARTVARVLGVALTSRSKGENAVPMAGVPFHAVETYLHRMIAAGFKVAICEQMEDPKAAKGLIKREVTRLVTRRLSLGHAESRLMLTSLKSITAFTV